MSELEQRLVHVEGYSACSNDGLWSVKRLYTTARAWWMKPISKGRLRKRQSHVDVWSTADVLRQYAKSTTKPVSRGTGKARGKGS